MLSPEHDALIQGAIDGTLTPEQREAFRRLMAGSAEAQNRAAQFEQLTELIESLGHAEAPPSLARDVAEKISPRAWPQPSGRAVPHVNPRRGIAVNKNLIYGLAAAAAVVLAVITYYSYPPATVGTEATIGAAQRAQQPQIAAQDVGLGDTATQEFLQSAEFDELSKDETIVAMLEDASLRQHLQDPELRKALENDAVRRALMDPALAKKLEDQAVRRQLNDAELWKKLDDANLRNALSNEAFLRALRNDGFRSHLAKAGWAEAMARPAFQNALKSRNFDAALRSRQFAEAMARARQARAR